MRPRCELSLPSIIRCSGSTSTQLPANWRTETRASPSSSRSTSASASSSVRAVRARVASSGASRSSCRHGQAHRGAALVGVQARQRQHAPGPHVIPGASRLALGQCSATAPGTAATAAGGGTDPGTRAARAGPDPPGRSPRRCSRAAERTAPVRPRKLVTTSKMCLGPPCASPHSDDARHQPHLAHVSGGEDEGRIVPEADGLLGGRPIPPTRTAPEVSRSSRATRAGSARPRGELERASSRKRTVCSPLPWARTWIAPEVSCSSREARERVASSPDSSSGVSACSYDRLTPVARGPPVLHLRGLDAQRQLAEGVEGHVRGEQLVQHAAEEERVPHAR